MKNIGLIKTVLAVLMLSMSCMAWSATVVINFQGTVNDAGNLTDSFTIGEVVTGTLSFTNGKTDQNTSSSEGYYQYSTGELRIMVKTRIGIFDTGLNNTGGFIQTVNNDPLTGNFTVIHSSSDGGADGSTNQWPMLAAIGSADGSTNQWPILAMAVRMQKQPGAPMINSDAEPSALTLSDWDSIFLTANGNNYNFGVNITSASSSVVPVPAAAWLLGSGLLGLIGVARRKTA